jgi:heptosyltransferase-2
MIQDSQNKPKNRDGGTEADRRPILIVPYMWIGDFVRCLSVVKLLKRRFPARPVDILSTALCAPLADYAPQVRQTIIADLPRNRLAYPAHRELAERLRREGYGSALVMPRTWKGALAPALAGIPERTGFVGELRFGILNDIRFGERRLQRMVNRCAALALPKGTELPTDLPLPELRVPPAEIPIWRERLGLAGDSRPVAALAPGSKGAAKRWPSEYFAALARRLAEQGLAVWVIGGPEEKTLAAEIVGRAGLRIHDLTGPDLRNAIVALAAADLSVSNDSGLLHVSAALGTRSIGIFGPTSPWHWAPLNPLAALVQTTESLACQPCHKSVCPLGHHRCMRDIPVERIAAIVGNALASTSQPTAQK